MVDLSIKKAKRNYTLNGIPKAKTNPKKGWDVIKTITNNKEPACHSSIVGPELAPFLATLFIFALGYRPTLLEHTTG